MPQPLIWVPLKQQGNAPSARSGHTITTVKNFHILFGGIDVNNKKNGKLLPNNQVYSLRITQQAANWQLQQCQGDPPLPRAHHSSCAISQDKLLIFGGYFSSTQRFNDVYILKITDFRWSQPPNQKSGSEPKNAESKIGAPDPRANHTATYHKGKVYIFGGHGGSGYQRTSFNDLYTLDCENFEWNKIENIEGQPPAPRGGHSAALLEDDDKIVFFGGWSNSSQFSDLFVYDINKNIWIDQEVNHDIPRWYHSGVIARAIPSWKYFIFGGSVGNFEEGGNRTVSKMSDEIFYLDILTYKWFQVQLETNIKPKARESGAMFFNENKLILFGGWSNQWQADLWALPISLITGPPYAIYGIKPSLGPLTGSTKIQITGDGFKDNSAIIVRFQAPGSKTAPEVQATFISETQISCQSPSFEVIGPKVADVTISINREDFTITSQKFTYFYNTKASQTIAFGPGLLMENSPNAKSIFVIQARNAKGQNRESGLDEFVVKIYRPKTQAEIEEEEEEKQREEERAAQKIEEQKKPKEEQEEEEEKEEGEEQKEGQEVPQKKSRDVPFELKDNDDGSYFIHYTYSEEIQNLCIEVQFKNEKDELEHIRGSPFKAGWKPGASAKNNELLGPQVFNHAVSSLNELDKFINDTKNNIDIRNINIKEKVYDLLKVKENLLKISERKEQIELLVDTIQQTLTTYEKHDNPKENEAKKVLRLKDEWNQLEKMSINVDKDITQPMKNWSEKTKENIQKFEEKLKEFQSGLKRESFYNYSTGVEDANERINEVNEKIATFVEELNDFTYFTRMFSYPELLAPAEKSLDQIKSELTSIKALWAHIEKCQTQFNSYWKNRFLEVNSLDIEDEVKKLRKELIELRGVDRKCNAFLQIQKEIKDWAIFLPLLAELKDPAMESADGRHWQKVKELVKKEFKIDETLELQTIWDLKLYEYKEGIEEITDQAKQEQKMEKNIQKIVAKWSEVVFELVQHKNTDLFTLKMLEENFEQLEEHQLMVNNMLLSKFIGFFEKDVEKWKQDLGSLYDVIGLLTDVQKTWSFLENLFIHSEEVKKELPNESEQFVEIDKDMKEIMLQGKQIMNILDFCTRPGRLKEIEKIQAALKICEKALNEFLDGKRKAFPRFYFVSVADLLDILSNGNSPEKVNKHMPKIYQAIETLELDIAPGDRPTAKVMNSCVGQEAVPFSQPLKLVGKVEVYLQDVINSMNSTLRNIGESSLKAHTTMSKNEWIKRDPAQITILIDNMIYAQKVEEAFKLIGSGTLDALSTLLAKFIEALNDLITQVRQDLKKSERQKLMCLITMDTHGRDIIDKLQTQNVRKPDEFQWQSQLKFYWDQAKNDARINICDAQFWYSYEYLGNGPRLVVTPLTDRIYVTATQALHLKMGCAPAGPAGTGKTETTKDLANGVAKACYVFNCSGEMSYETMGNIFKGLASSGCWGCFDEFNRLVPEVLSVCSVQFKCVTDAIKYQKQRFQIEGDEISLDPTCGAFITMNPGYLGRSELPEGLKALFRPITVVVPDLELICENMLMAEGFIHAKTLAKKFVTLYFLCKDLLSKSDHYDWGLRAIKSVLVVAGGFKRAEQDVEEDWLLMRALRDFNIPKVIAADLPIFFGLLGDLFPGIEIPRKRNMNFEKKIEEACDDAKLYKEPEFILKVVQLQELLEIRHCVFILGPPASGKSTVWKQLAKANDKFDRKTTYRDINPKVISTKDFYGYNLPSKEWKDGLFSNTLRQMAEQPDTNTKWIILDGDLDANWIESMNSVMDDNKLLTLANNERIPLKPHMRQIFEIRDLKFASPATVSRAGILYISDDSGHQWRSYVKSWIKEVIQKQVNNPEQQKQIDEKASTLQKFFDKYISNTLLYLRKSCKQVIPVSGIAMVIALCNCLSKLLQTEYSNIEYAFVFALIWCLGGSLTEKDGIDYRKLFSGWWKSEWKTTAVKFPAKGAIYDYYVEQSDKGVKFEEWQKKVQTIDFNPAKGMMMSGVTVPTRETVAVQDFVQNFVSQNYAVMLIGNSGCGKTQLCKGILQGIVDQFPDSYQFQSINFNYFTDSEYLQKMLEQELEKKGGKQMGPKGKARLIYYIDDLNMPQLDPYNTQTAIALLRQHADYQHWYDITKLTTKEIINTQHLATMNPSAGSFFVNPRYMRHFWICSVPFPDQESLFLIYNTFLTGHLRTFKGSVLEFASPIIKAAWLLHSAVISSFRKTAINFHYEFNIRHLSGVFAGILASRSNEFAEPEKFIRLWIHESERTYADRLVSWDHINQYKALMFDILKKNLSRFSFQKYFQKDPENLLFCNFVTSLTADRFYDQMPNEKLEPVVSDALKDYNDNNPNMNLVLFDDALKHVLRITRIVMQPQGHALLVGVGGSGKQSLSKLASHIMQFTTFMITISTTYNMGDLRTDLQQLYFKTGVKEEGFLFLFTEGQITNERFLVYINDLLSSGEIADLYDRDEKEPIVNAVRQKVKSEGRPDNRDSCWQWFLEKVKKNLHMSICFSPVGDIRKRARQFPALINCTVIDWFQPWPQEALQSVATNFLKEENLGEQEIHDAIVKFMPFSFKIVNDLSREMLEREKRYIYTTPKSFLELIQLYKSMVNKKRIALEEDKERYETGLTKLQETAATVAIIEEDVKVKQIEAEIKKKEADEFATTVGIEKEKVEKENAKASEEADKCSVIKKDVEEKKSSTQADLDAAVPLVEEAKAALDSISKKDFQTAKAYATPPQGIPEVFAAAIYMLAGFWPEAIEIDNKSKKPKKCDWPSAKKLMGNPDDLIRRLKEFKDTVDANLVTPANVQVVKTQYLSQSWFNEKEIKGKSQAAAGICLWVINIVKYWDVIQDVEPKRKALKEATEQLEAATEKLNQVEAIVSKLNAELAILQSKFDAAVAEKEAAINEAERCKRRLNLAQRLVTALSSENERWGKSIIERKADLDVVVGDVLISSSFISYAGPFNKQFRDEMINKHFNKFLKDNKIPTGAILNPVKILTNEAQIALWNKEGLPADEVSVQNGTILINSERWPLMVDPQLQGGQWIKEKEKNCNLKCCRLGSATLNRDLEFAIEQGYSVLIENMGERIDAILMPIIARQFIKRGRNKIMKFGGKDLLLSAEFKLFMHTKLSNPHYPPEIQAEATMINFTVTEEGLGDQLLTLVVKKERPDLAKKKIKLITQQNDFKIKLKELEDGLLYKLANAKGDILDNIELIENLESSKRISVEVSKKVAIAQKTEIKINQTSEVYRPAATRGALFYFLLKDLAKIHSFYKYSLESFIVVIDRAIDAITEKKAVIEEEKQPEEAEKPQDEAEPPKQQEQEEKKEGEGQAEEKKEEEKKDEGDEPKPEEQQQEAPNEDERHEEGDEEKEGGEEEGEQKEEEEEEENIEEPLSPRSLNKRVSNLIESITYIGYLWLRRGLFEKHKIIVISMLCFRILIRDDQLDKKEVEHLIMGKFDPNPGPMPDVLKNFLQDTIWAACKSLELIPAFANFCNSLEVESLQWRKWFNEEKAEFADLPKTFKEMSKFHRLLLLRAMRPDRLSSALSAYICDTMGDKYIEQQPFNIFDTYKETTPATPIFFVLFPGVDPTPEVERVGEANNITAANGKFINISMGQGQEERARDAIFKCAKEGGWVMLQNVHLMQTWMQGMKGLEGFLEQVSLTANQNFRCFISSEPPPLPLWNIIPESILQSCLKVSNEASQDIKANLKRSYAKFSQEFIDQSPKPNEFKAILFALCFFHSIVVGRKKFGSQGWSRQYSFNDGDLLICADVLHNYLKGYDVVPYDDIRYIYGEIMYGGHITDNWDRRTNETYLKFYITPALLQNMNLAPLFKSPDPSKFDYEAYNNYIDTKLPIESPQMFQMNGNAEIGYLTSQCDQIMSTILEVQGGSTGGGGKKESEMTNIIQDLKNRTPPEYNLVELQIKIKEKDQPPSLVVCLQEAERMNNLLFEIKNSLEELQLGLNGALNMTDSMENLLRSLIINKVPENWEKVAYFSKKGLQIWFLDLIERNSQLTTWSTELITPMSLCISYLFNPMSYLTAVMQTTARQSQLPLDNMCLQTLVTASRKPEDLTEPAKEGVYVHGLFLEGASWELGSQGQPGYLIEQKLKELHPVLPVVNVQAVPTQEKITAAQYQCPVYVTSNRGGTYVFTANLNMESDDMEPTKWILAGVCLLMSDD